MPIQPIINTKAVFYDYFPHIPVMRMKADFGLGFFEQCMIRTEIQNVISSIYERLLDVHDLRHYNIYGEISEEFDDNFYRELKEAAHVRFINPDTWAFLDKLMPYREIEDKMKNQNFQTRMTATLSYSLPKSKTTNRIDLKDALIALLNFDLESLSGRELLYLTKIK